jgi:O-antigen ligase
VALIGILQFFTGLTLVDAIQIPGLKVNNGGVASLDGREGFTRVSGTTINPIEFGVVVSSMLPLCLHVALTDPSRRAVRWLPVVCVAIAIPLSISRSALIAVGLALAILFVTWDKRMRVAAAAGVLVVAGAVFVVIPGMLGTLSGMFTGVQDDSSALSRTDSYALALDFVGRSPWVGRGFLTFLPEYRTLDNQYLGLLIDLGFLGTAALVVMFVVAIAYGIHWRSRIVDPKTRGLLVSMIAALSASAVSFAFFDALSFPMIAGLTFLLIGMIDSLGRYLHVPIQRARPRPPARDLGLPGTVHGSDEEHPVAETLAPASRVWSG